MHLGKYRSLQLGSRRWDLASLHSYITIAEVSTGAREAQRFLGKSKKKNGKEVFI